MFFVYVLYSEPYDRYYVGQTDNLERRFERHNAGMVFSTKPYKPWNLVYFEEFQTRSEAVKREREIKKQKSRKYIESFLNRWSPDGCRD